MIIFNWLIFMEKMSFLKSTLYLYYTYKFIEIILYNNEIFMINFNFNKISNINNFYKIFICFVLYLRKKNCKVNIQIISTKKVNWFEKNRDLKWFTFP